MNKQEERKARAIALLRQKINTSREFRKQHYRTKAQMREGHKVLEGILDREWTAEGHLLGLLNGTIDVDFVMLCLLSNGYHQVPLEDQVDDTDAS